MGRQRKRKKRGYPVALVIGFGEGHNTYAIFWQIFSERIKPLHPHKISLGRKAKYANENHIYHYFEELIDTIRPILKKGVQSILVVSELSYNLPDQFLNHIEKHYRWMMHNPRHPVEFGALEADVTTKFAIQELREREDFQELLLKIRDKESAGILQLFEKRVSQDDSAHPTFLVGLPEIEQFIYSRSKSSSSGSPSQIQAEYLLVTETYLNKTPAKNRLHRLLQIAENKQIKTRILSEETSAYDRIQQFGGIICFTESPKSYRIRKQGMEE